MSLSRDSWVTAANLIAESAWLFAALGVAGIAMGLDASPLSWPAVLIILGIAALVAKVPSPSILVALASGSAGLIAYGALDGPMKWLLVLAAIGAVATMLLRSPLKETSLEAGAALRAIFGAGVAYLMIASGVTLGEGGFDLVWLSDAFVEDANPAYKTAATLGATVSAFLWWRGGSLAGKEFPIENHVLSFRLGVFVLATATAIDIVSPTNLGTFPMVFIFFAAGLAGLEVGHLLPESRLATRARTWPKVLGAAVVSVLLAGIVFSFMGSDAFGFISNPALSTFRTVIDGVFWGLAVPISILAGVLMAVAMGIIETIFGGLAGTGLGGFLSGAGDGGGGAFQPVIEEEEGGELISFVLLLAEWALIIAASLFLVYAIYRLLRHVLSRASRSTIGIRESLKDDAHFASDLGRLLSQLVPGRGKNRKPNRGFTLPDAQSGIVDVLRAYYKMLATAEDLGYRRRRHQTPTEFQAVLETLFPSQIVQSATTAFVYACYGDHPATDAQVTELTASIRSLGT